MKLIKYFLIGIFFGIVMTKSQVISWFRIQEMFRFQSFHMYGIIGCALVIGALGLFLIKKMRMKNLQGEAIQMADKQMGVSRYLFGGIVFGLGWALSGACPGPMYTLLGAGQLPILVVILSAVLGTWTYAWLRDILPH